MVRLAAFVLAAALLASGASAEVSKTAPRLTMRALLADGIVESSAEFVDFRNGGVTGEAVAGEALLGGEAVAGEAVSVGKGVAGEALLGGEAAFGEAGAIGRRRNNRRRS